LTTLLPELQVHDQNSRRLIADQGGPKEDQPMFWLLFSTEVFSSPVIIQMKKERNNKQRKRITRGQQTPLQLHLLLSGSSAKFAILAAPAAPATHHQQREGGGKKKQNDPAQVSTSRNYGWGLD
jgi:hypothetical protein